MKCSSGRCACISWNVRVRRLIFSEYMKIMNPGRTKKTNKNNPHAERKLLKSIESCTCCCMKYLQMLGNDSHIKH